MKTGRRIKDAFVRLQVTDIVIHYMTTEASEASRSERSWYSWKETNDVQVVLETGGC